MEKKITKKNGVIKITVTDVELEYEFHNPTFNSFEEAIKALEKMKMDIESLGNVNVAYLYNLADQDVEYDDIYHGWYDLGQAAIHCGFKTFYICNLPKPVILEDVLESLKKNDLEKSNARGEYECVSTIETEGGNYI